MRRPITETLANIFHESGKDERNLSDRVAITQRPGLAYYASIRLADFNALIHAGVAITSIINPGGGIAVLGLTEQISEPAGLQGAISETTAPQKRERRRTAGRQNVGVYVTERKPVRLEDVFKAVQEEQKRGRLNDVYLEFVRERIPRRGSRVSSLYIAGNIPEFMDFCNKIHFASRLTLYLNGEYAKYRPQIERMAPALRLNDDAPAKRKGPDRENGGGGGMLMRGKKGRGPHNE